MRRHRPGLSAEGPGRRLLPLSQRHLTNLVTLLTNWMSLALKPFVTFPDRWRSAVIGQTRFVDAVHDAASGRRPPGRRAPSDRPRSGVGRRTGSHGRRARSREVTARCTSRTTKGFVAEELHVDDGTIRGVGRAELHRSPALRRHETQRAWPRCWAARELLTDDVTGVRELDLDDARIRTRSGWPGVR